VDDRCAELNDGSYQNIPPSVTAVARQECESFIHEHVERGQSFLVETTLRTDVSIEQARLASTAAFITEMYFFALDTVEENIRRAKIREAGGGRTITEETIRAIHRASLQRLPVAMHEFHRVTVMDNSGETPRAVLVIVHGEITYDARPRPAWLVKALIGSEYEG
jgi:predicted ABC-type ATPase